MDLKYDRSSSDGPTKLDIQVDAGSGFTSVFTDLSVSENGENINNIDLTAFINITETIRFRLYAYEANSALGTLDIEEHTTTNKGIIIKGVVSAIPCIGLPITWNGSNWFPIDPPLITSHVIIAGDYNTTTHGSFKACSLTISPGFELRVTDEHYVEIINDVSVDGRITVESQGNFVQNNGASTTKVNAGGAALVSKTKTMQKWYTYTYWSSPSKTETIESALGNTPIDRRFTFNAANYEDLLSEVNNTNTFIAGQDGIDDDGNDWVNTPTGAMTPGVGYAAVANELGTAFPRQEIFEFYGDFNNGDVIVPLVNNSGGAYEDWNLVGNPYPGAISADQFFLVNSGLVDLIYLWDQSTPPSSNNSGSQGSNFSNDDYAIINGVGEIGARADTGTPPSRFIPSGQGFFVIAQTSGNLTFSNSMRGISHDNSLFFKSPNTKNKKSDATVSNKLWVNLTSDNGVYKQIMIGYVNGATNGNDGAFYDAPRDYASLKDTSLYSIIESDNGKFAIQGKDVNSLNKNENIKLGFKSTIKVATLFKLSIAQLHGNFFNKNTIYLKDNLLNQVHNLSESNYTFTSEAGEFNDRFEIAFDTEGILSADPVIMNKNDINIVELHNNRVQFNIPENLKIKSVKIFDLFGRQLYNFIGQNSTETYTLYNVSNMVYIAKITLSNDAVITKKAVKK
ncbi:hypothetical protein APS56_11675 [Pseudalgibacter alginicilyticus]|uniref:Secretion system C-terminal sorting domain-containing protein n=2 Tax=Pseudalgibacter alginicilyticus TaxID=1736674 RepID=A0A0P0DCL8_9FLAO|nr:hypothetical protein APS56_11675 [Pseudalgibacter alginicilyticus]